MRKGMIASALAGLEAAFKDDRADVFTIDFMDHREPTFDVYAPPFAGNPRGRRTVLSSSASDRGNRKVIKRSMAWLHRLPYNYFHLHASAIRSAQTRKAQKRRRKS